MPKSSSALCLFDLDSTQVFRPDDRMYFVEVELGGETNICETHHVTFRFRVFCCQVFGLKLSPRELGAVMQEFDKDGDGTVNCAEFLLTFFRIGFEGRNRALQR